MTVASARPATLHRSPAFWALLGGSLAAFGYGGWLVLDKTSMMSAKLTDGSATGADVYVGQVWAVVGGGFLIAGLIGLIVALGLAILRSFFAVAAGVAPVAAAHDGAPSDTDAAYGRFDATPATNVEPAEHEVETHVVADVEAAVAADTEAKAGSAKVPTV